MALLFSWPLLLGRSSPGLVLRSGAAAARRQLPADARFCQSAAHGVETCAGRAAAASRRYRRPVTGRRDRSERVDLAVVGAGPAGVAAAITAVEHGLRVVCVDKARFPRDKT